MNSIRTQIKVNLQDGVATILMEPPYSKPPTLDGAVFAQLESVIAQLELNDAVRLIVLRSTSERFFCVGADINVLKDIDENSIESWVKEGHSILNRLEDIPVPVIAVVEGYAMGGGLEIAMACDLIFASDKAQFAQSEAGLGFIPGWGGSHRLVKRIGKSQAKYYFYSGAIINASKAAIIGLADFVGSKLELEIELEQFTAAVVSKNQNALTQFKAILNDADKSARNVNAKAEASRSVSCLEDPDTKRRISEFLNRKVAK